MYSHSQRHMGCPFSALQKYMHRAHVRQASFPSLPEEVGFTAAENPTEGVQEAAKVSKLPENNSNKGNGACCRASLCKSV